MVIREPAIGAGANYAQTAIDASHITTGAWTHLLGSGARRDRRSVWNEVREVLQQAMLARHVVAQERVGIHCLVQVRSMLPT